VRPAALAGLLAAALLAGCGSAPADLFVVTRSGADRNANVTMRVSDGGSVTCNGVKHPLSADELLTARQLARDLAPQAELSLQLPAPKGTLLSYRVRLEQGTVAFGDRSRDMPQSFNRLAAFTKDVTEGVCGIIRR
jgi:hypothetical protein